MSYIGKLKACCEQAGRAQDDSKRIARGWATDRTVRAKVDANLRTQGLDADSIMAASFVDGIDELAAIEKLLASAELRAKRRSCRHPRHRGCDRDAFAKHRRESVLQPPQHGAAHRQGQGSL